jgi:uncharacterized membrane protein
VLLNERVLAMLHGGLAALVLSLMAALVVLTSRGWFAVGQVSYLSGGRVGAADGPGGSGSRLPSSVLPANDFPTSSVSAPAKLNPEDLSLHSYRNTGTLDGQVGNLSYGRWLKVLAVATPVVVFVQFLLGGMLRHLGLAVLEHVGFALMALAFVVTSVIVSRRQGTPYTARASWWMLGAALLQIGLGAAAWLHKFGFAPAGYVAVHGSPAHIVFRSAHTVGGMLLLMTAVVHAVRVYRTVWVARQTVAAGSLPAAGEPLAAATLPAAPGGGEIGPVLAGSNRRAARCYAGGRP